MYSFNVFSLAKTDFKFKELKLRCSELSVKIQTDEVEFRAKVLKNYLFQKVRLSPKK